MKQQRMRPVANRKTTLLAVSLLSVTFLSYQNCANNMQFDGEALSLNGKFTQPVGPEGDGGDVVIQPIIETEVQPPGGPVAGADPIDPVVDYHPPIEEEEGPIRQNPIVDNPIDELPPGEGGGTGWNPIAANPIAPLDPVSPNPGSEDADPEQPIKVPPVAGNEDRDEDEDSGNDKEEHEMEFDHAGKRIAMGCITGASKAWNHGASKTAKDVTIVNHVGSLSVKGHVNDLVVRDLKGSLIARTVANVKSLENVEARFRGIQVRSHRLERAERLGGTVVSLAAQRMDSVANVRAGFACFGSETLGTLEDVRAVAVKVRGIRSPSSALASAQARRAVGTQVKNVKAAFISISSSDLDQLSDIEGEVILRGVVVKELKNLKGGLTLINSKVEKLVNMQGPVRVKGNSKIAERHDAADEVIAKK